MDPHEEGTISTSSSSQRHSKKIGTGYDSPTSQNSKQRYRRSQSRSGTTSTPTFLPQLLQNNKDQGEDMLKQWVDNIGDN